MKKYVAICAMLVALTWVGIAAADTPQGKLTGSALLSAFGQLTITTAILDGGTSYVGQGNDKSNPDTCNLDSGAVTVGGLGAANVVCAHYVAASLDGSGPKMRFAYEDPRFPGCYQVLRISDGGATDKVGIAEACVTLAQIQAWVNTGILGSGIALDPWFFSRVTGNFTITASQT